MRCATSGSRLRRTCKWRASRRVRSNFRLPEKDLLVSLQKAFSIGANRILGWVIGLAILGLLVFASLYR